MRGPFLLPFVGLLFFAPSCADLGGWPAGGPRLPAGAYPLPPLGERVALRDPGLREASGLAASLLRPGLVWAVNDSGNPPQLFALDGRGHTVERHRLEGAGNRDWESLDSFWWEGRPILLVADVGDNAGRRVSCRLYFVDEREPGRVLASAPLTYADGAKDCEGVVAVPAEDAIYLVAKRDPRSTVYRAPLAAAMAGREVLAEPVAALPLEAAFPMPLAKLARHSKFGQQVTGLAVREDPPQATVWLTYTHTYRAAGILLPGRPRLPLRYPELKQAEGLAAPSWDPRALWIISEGDPGTLVRILIE